ncbi:hypothetical protein AtNW77_Chr3g0205621 [Arabidopsis thaliana]|uniref:Prolamin-like domain-containing protein n=3 Tax=Arabidopsis TaxID=3701 RepID=A0A178V825_ARATH|nr:hypothetical protein ISN45_At03g043130 [Arabidopsis thaliana x Arabidopsis arenosa]KAG7633932.1 hypothetical protein ISN44_As03g042040 [Arabidopsis suecica]OAP02036.1 hypothetical protein AXX17_AT3G44820 [Arabidopsis thaliana]
MKTSIVLVAAAFLCLVAFPTTTVGKYWPKIEGWPNPSEISRNELMLLNTGHSFGYGDSKVWKCTYSNGSAPAISISPSTPIPSTPSTPSPPPPAPKKSPPPPTPKKSPSPPSLTPFVPHPTPKKSPSPPPTPSLPPPAPKKSPSTPSLPPPTPKKSPPPPPSHHSSSPSNPPHHQQNPWEHIERCMINMGPVGMCRMQMEVSFYTRLFQVSDYCCNLVVNMKSECDDVAWGFFNDPFFVPLVRYTCHVTC